jgi:hypothetical protein
MELWMAVLLFCLAFAGIVASVLFARQGIKRKWRVAATVVASLFLLAAMAYILITFIFLEAI